MVSVSQFIALGLGLGSVQAASNATLLPVHNITRIPGVRFENLAIRENGQILTTTASPNASIYQVDPLGILPPTLVHTIPDIGLAAGIAEGKPDVFYVASGNTTITQPFNVTPSTYSITEINMRGVAVLPDGTLSQKPTARRVANLTDASLLNGIAFARPESDHLLVADSFRGLIWNVNIRSGAVAVALNDSSTKGVPGASNATFTGINGLKVQSGTAYYGSTGTNQLFSVPINANGTVPYMQTPRLIASGITIDDLIIDEDETHAYVCSPADVITKVTLATGEGEVLAGIFNSADSPLIAPTAVRFGRMASDRFSLYVSTNGGMFPTTPTDSEGISRIDLGAHGVGF